MHTGQLVLVEAEAEHKARLQMVVVEILAELLLATLVVSVAPPYLQLHDILLAEIVDDHIRSGQVAHLRLTIVVADAIDDRTEVSEEYLAAVVLHELVIMTRAIKLLSKW